MPLLQVLAIPSTGEVSSPVASSSSDPHWPATSAAPPATAGGRKRPASIATSVGSVRPSNRKNAVGAHPSGSEGAPVDLTGDTVDLTGDTSD